MVSIKLNNDWKMRATPLSWGPEMRSKVDMSSDGWLEINLPCDVHMPLIENGIIEEPLVRDNFTKCEWIEDRAWWFKKIFHVDKSVLEADAVELMFESLDSEADVFLNGDLLGHHRSAFYPFVRNVKDSLKEGENSILVRVTCGHEHFSENDIADIAKYVITEKEYGAGDRGDKRRAWVRKPQYVYGWDWGPRLASCGIMGDVRIDAYNALAIRGVNAFTKKISGNAEIGFEVEVENLHPYSTLETCIGITVQYEAETVMVLKKEILLKAGVNFVSFEGTVENPRLWWPNGMGRQDLYTVRISASSGQYETEYPEFDLGIRTVALNMDRIEGGKRQFVFEINGVRIFAKGGNWIPTDFIYARATESSYDFFLEEAKEANFNIMRVCGVGIYERDYFYKKCDRLGIMVWQDFMFSCSLYPDRLQWFCDEVTKEIDYQTRRLRNHCSLVLLSGNNECQWAMDDVFVGERTPEYMGGARIYNDIAPRIIKMNCPDILYWNGCPYGGVHPNGYDVGDHHHWNECTKHPEMEKRITPEEYDKVTAGFVSEFGYLGPCKKSSIERYHDGLPIDMNGQVWKHHTNVGEYMTVNAGITKHYIDADKLDLDEYLLYGGLCQGLMLGYALESLRYILSCHGGLIWSFNDCWGEVGWSIVDYYMKRKIAYYAVKRAFSPVKLILREEGGIIKAAGINDTAADVVFKLKYGYISFDGEKEESHEIEVILEAHSRKNILEFEKGGHDLSKGCYFAALVNGKDGGSGVLPAILRSGVFRNLDVPAANLEIVDFKSSAGKVKFTVKSNVYAHAVHFNLDDSIRLSDEYFDLLPGESREIEVLNESADIFAQDLRPVCVLPPNWRNS